MSTAPRALRQRRAVSSVSVLLLGVLVGGCGSSVDNEEPASTSPSTSLPATTAPGGVDLAPTDHGDCEYELATIRTALEAYRAMNGADPATLDELAGGGPGAMLEEVPDPTRWTAPNGPAAGIVGIGRCAGVG